jgi:DNA-binding response OmpR family regulator
MSSIRRGSMEVRDLSVPERLESSGDVVEACRIGDALACVPEGARKLRVLVVDDDHDCADGLSRLVNLWGNDVQTACDGAAALALTVDRQPDVVLLDLSMPKMDGCQLARQLRQQRAFADMLLIAVTGWTDQAHQLLCVEAGFDNYLVKPIDLARLKILLLRERHRLAWSTEEVEKSNGTGGAVITAAKKAAFSRADSAVDS